MSKSTGRSVSRFVSQSVNQAFAPQPDGDADRRLMMQSRIEERLRAYKIAVRRRLLGVKVNVSTP